MASRLLAAFILGIVTVQQVVAAPSNVVVTWHYALQAVVAKYGIPSQIAQRMYALEALAVYHPLRRIKAQAQKYKYDASAVATYAAHYTLSEWFPELQSNVFDPLAASILDPYHFSATQAFSYKSFALQYAIQLTEVRVYDHSQDFADYHPYPAGTVGKYQYVPVPLQNYVLYPQLAKTRPLVITGPAAFDKKQPLVVGTAKYNRLVRQVKKLGYFNSTKATPYQQQTAFFWADLSYTSSIAGHWFNISLLAIPDDTDIFDVARLFAYIGVAQYDSAIVGWYQKFKYQFWRPITAIREGDPANAPNAMWLPFLSTPFHPEYPSTHAVASGASAGIIAKFLDIKAKTALPGGAVSVRSPFVPTLPPRTYTSLNAIAKEVAISRMYGGVHFLKSSFDGLTVGYNVANYVWEHFAFP